jgi:hypothetical protein
VVVTGAAVGIAVGITSNHDRTFDANLGTVGPSSPMGRF